MIPEPIKPEPITTTLDIGASTWELVDKHFLFKTASGSLVENEGLRMEAMIQILYRITSKMANKIRKFLTLYFRVTSYKRFNLFENSLYGFPL